MGKANTNQSKHDRDSKVRSGELIDLEEASRALDLPREILWGLLQHESVSIHSQHEGKHAVPAIYERDLQRLRSTTPPDPKQVFAKMLEGTSAEAAPTEDAPAASPEEAPLAEAAAVAVSEPTDTEAPAGPEVAEAAESSASVEATPAEVEETPTVAEPAATEARFEPAAAAAPEQGTAVEAELRRQLVFLRSELEKHSQPLWVRLRSMQHEHEQSVFEARLAKGQLGDAKARLQQSEETLAVLRRDLAKALETTETERRRRLDSEETQQRLAAACERFEKVNQRLSKAGEDLARARAELAREQNKNKDSDALRIELMAEREKLAAAERRFLETERRHADELRKLERAPAPAPAPAAPDAEARAAFEAEIATLRQSLKEVQGRYEGSQRARLAQERYCERIEVRLAEALARITKLQRLSEKPPQRSAA